MNEIKKAEGLFGIFVYVISLCSLFVSLSVNETTFLHTYIIIRMKFLGVHLQCFIFFLGGGGFLPLEFSLGCKKTDSLKTNVPDDGV